MNSDDSQPVEDPNRSAEEAIDGLQPPGLQLPDHAPAKRSNWEASEQDSPVQETSVHGVGVRLLSRMGPVLTSSILHAVVLILLALWVIAPPENRSTSPLLTVTPDDGEGIQLGELSMNQEEVAPLEPSVGVSTDLVEQVLETPPTDWTVDSFLESPLDATTGVDLAPSDLTTPIPTGVSGGPALGGGFQGRTAAARAAAIGDGGASAESEAAVERGLAYLARHQMPDGSWHFHLTDLEGCTCTYASEHQSTTAATGLALLPFLGAGYTHLDGKYKEVVHKGIYYLVNRMRDTPAGGDLRETDRGTMYEQGIATMALCEAYAMTHDRSLRTVTQSAVDFIVNAQHEAGGWRYSPRMPGDTTVTGWQVMALKSAYLGRLNVRRDVWYKVRDYLDSVQLEGGAFYVYRITNDTENLNSNTAIGLLLRMLLGWPHDRKELRAGVSHLDGLGPSANNLYYDYYATLVMHHYEGRMWKKWNEQMRDHLVSTQVREGHMEGSWFFTDQLTREGGRLYNTAMATMILEVYYRYMPLYSKDATLLP